MKKFIVLVLTAVMLFSISICAFAVGEGNIDNGGGGMGSGTSTNKWIPGEEGVRVTVVRASDGAQVSQSFDMTNINLRDSVYTFGIYSKLRYRNGEVSLVLEAADYTVIRPTISMPRIISSGSSSASIDEIKRYFCSEYAVQLVANTTGIEYDTLINGQYKILIEPVAYFLFNGNYFAMSAHQAALYDQMLSGGLRSKMVSLTHKNLPLAMFLERAELGYPAWTGTTTKNVSNDTIINYLGLGVVHFTEEPIPEESIETPDPEEDDWWYGFGWMYGVGNGNPAGPQYAYRTDTDVITSIRVTADQEYNPDNPLSARFVIDGNNYLVEDIVIPEDESQIVWVKWHTPDEPGEVTIRVTVGGRTRTARAAIEEIVDNEPPDPKANDRNDLYQLPNVPVQTETETLSWGVWSASWHEYWEWIPNWEWTGTHWVDNGQWVDNGWYDFTFNRYHATLNANQSISPNSKVPTASGNRMKSGYGFDTSLECRIDTNAPVRAYTQAQTTQMFFPEFEYSTYFRVLDRNVQSYRSTFQFKENRYSTYKSRSHFTPVWFPDGAYKTYTMVYDAWTPAGMLRVNKTASLNLVGNLFEDWHIAPKN
ncbi:MAG: hypothetical protein J6K43_03340 [Lachnospiraceae bacterium]|nr:hypothetical protein [Lachnospiraceae bacterium]